MYCQTSDKHQKCQLFGHQTVVGTHLSKQGERHQLQYTSVNLLEIDADIFIDTRFSKKCMTYGRILEKY